MRGRESVAFRAFAIVMAYGRSDLEWLFYAFSPHDRVR